MNPNENRHATERAVPSVRSTPGVQLNSAMTAYLAKQGVKLVNPDKAFMSIPLRLYVEVETNGRGKKIDVRSHADFNAAPYLEEAGELALASFKAIQHVFDHSSTGHRHKLKLKKLIADFCLQDNALVLAQSFSCDGLLNGLEASCGATGQRYADEEILLQALQPQFCLKRAA
ncbi:MAG: hypothetical protein DI585_06210 [Pseudomonas fluorescens]|nr:MAG: hypothetical protein DI585_06210 [Pseudomonas fluorescens]